MEPRIQYAKTSDGVSIAYATLGEGMPLVTMPALPWSHIQMDWQIPEYARWMERFAENRRLVKYDGRGTGLSERNVTDFSLDFQVLDLEAVVKRLGLEKFALNAFVHAGPVALAYAAQHPERVSHLVLWNAYALGSDYAQAPQIRATRSLLEQDWELYTETAAHAFMGWSAGESAHAMAALMRECITLASAKASYAAYSEFDVTSLLSDVRVPTLILHRRQAAFPVDLAKALASAIPDARLVLLEGASLAPFLGDTEPVVRAIDEFLGEGGEAAASAELPEGMAVILFADIVESTALTERLGDAAFRDKARELDTSLRTVIRECSGTPVEGKLVGDGVLAVFTSARQAIECALRCNAAGEPMGLQLHLGIHAGDVIREGNNVYGGAVNIAARIATASAPGEVLVSNTVRGLARTSAGVSFDDRGEHELKGVGEPQRLFALRGGE